MAISSITADFLCDDPKAANAFVRMMFSSKALSTRNIPDTSSVRIRDDMRQSEKRAFWMKVLRSS